MRSGWGSSATASAARLAAFSPGSRPGSRRAGYVTDPAWSFCGSDACFSATDEDWSHYQERLAVLNPVNYIGRNTGAALLFQASKTDQIMLESNVVALYDAAPQPKSLKWYERGDSGLYDMGGHSLGCVTFGSCDPALPAFADHRAWPKEQVQSSPRLDSGRSALLG
jgi:hypothetical protein